MLAFPDGDVSEIFWQTHWMSPTVLLKSKLPPSLEMLCISRETCIVSLETRLVSLETCLVSFESFLISCECFALW